MDCLETLRLAGRMELHFNEPEAVTAGGKRGGKYLEMIGKYDLRELTPTEWFDFCAIIFEGTTDHLREQAKSQIKPEPHVRKPS